jgi:hypothetical protein
VDKSHGMIISSCFAFLGLKDVLIKRPRKDKS